jgi:hypothetical protein
MNHFKIVLFSLLGFCFFSCCRNYVSLQEQWIDKEYLASSYVNTPDKEACCPPCGKNLLIEWNFPISIFKEQLYIILSAKLSDSTVQIYKYKIPSKRGYIAKFFSYKDFDKKLLTYKVEIFNRNDKLIERVENQFWVEETIKIESSLEGDF